MRAGAVIKDFVHPADAITLDQADRHRRRVRLVSDHGIAFLLDLPEARLLKHGDGLLLDDGRVIEVRAAREHLYRIEGRDRRHLTAIAWQLGNRHLPAQIMDGHIRIRRDPVIGEMLMKLGARVREVFAPFDPEGGAYGDHAHEPAHSHSHHRHDDSTHS